MNNDLLIKVCGMRNADNIRAVTRLNIDMIGFICHKESPRFVPLQKVEFGMTPDTSEEQTNRLLGLKDWKTTPDNIQRVGVFVDDMPQTIISYAYTMMLDAIQLHGNETPTMIENLRATLHPDIRPGIKFIKALPVTTAEDLTAAEPYQGIADLLLFDTRCKTHGGSGKKFDWDILTAYQGQTPFLVSGGIGPDDVEAIRRFHHPGCIGIDVNSCFETAPAVKDVTLLSRFVDALRQ